MGKPVRFLVLSMSSACFEVFGIPKASNTPVFKCENKEMVHSHQLCSLREGLSLLSCLHR